MRILMISPHPTYSPRGTPISVLNRCRALCALGHQIDLVTYGIGVDVPVAGLTWLRAPVPGINKVKVGPSASKFPLDLAVFVRAVVQAFRGRRDYDVIHTHEEAGIVGAVLSRIFGWPHVYDMGNDLSVVLANYGFSPRHLLTRIAVAVETATIRGSHSVIAHFGSIAARVQGIADGAVPATVVVNVPIEAPAKDAEASAWRERWSPDCLPIVLYTGTLERYQGVPALVEAIQRLQMSGKKCRLVVVGGSSTQQDALRALAADYKVADVVNITGEIGQNHIRSCLQAADILVSPRAGGSNTPLKIFSYLQSGKPVLATRIAGHIQVLDEDSALLVEPTAEGLAEGLRDILENPERAAQRAAVAQRLAHGRYGLAEYINGVAAAYAAVGGEPVTAASVECAQRVVHDNLIRAGG